ncbi:Hsp20/alpha crystallin family protein [Spirulina subsalsa]|uniref:Hsp20/alpha crystallin family protein n=1 Tax=Spirulina subsalsa TaxID=54311 RepID=UPI0002EB42DA|nr:Hsp20/alpha crystallin family protein [Spirulina subsalsa]
MALIRWQPFAEMETLRHQMDQLFDEITQKTYTPSALWKPAIELKDTEDKLILQVQLPGITPDDLDINVTREAVSIQGEYRSSEQSEDKGLYHSEFRYGQFKRVIPLPIAIQNEQVTASFEQGILTLTLPKVTEAVNRVVKVKLNGDNSSNSQLPSDS